MNTKLLKFIKDIWSIELVYKRSIAVLITIFILVVYPLWGAILLSNHPEFYDGFVFRLLTVLPFSLLIFLNVPKYFPSLKSGTIILFIAISVNLSFQYLIIKNHYHEYYLVGFIMMIGLALSAFNSLSHILSFSVSSFGWYFWSFFVEQVTDPRISFWAGMILTLVLGSFGYFIARMSLLVERKNNLSKLSEQYNELVATQKELLQKESEAISTSQLAALSEMAGGIAHEINNPLAIIQGQVGLLQKSIAHRTFDIEKGSQILEKILKTSDRISRIIKGLILMTSPRESDSFRQVSLFEVMFMSLDICHERMRSLGIEIRYSEVEIRRCSVDCSLRELTQVFVSLMFNSIYAIKNTPNPWIEIKVLTNVVRNNRSETQIRFIDSGHGIHMAIQEKIFNPFFTTKPTGEGIGLGLSISKSLVEKWGAVLWYDTKSQNTCFVISFPNLAQKQ